MKRWHLAHWCAEVSTRLFSNLKSRQESTTDAVLDVKDNHASNRTIPGGYAFSLASIECLPTVNPPNAPMNQESRSAPSNLKPLVRTRETISAMVPPPRKAGNKMEDFKHLHKSRGKYRNIELYRQQIPTNSHSFIYS